MQNITSSAFTIHLFCPGKRSKKQMKWKMYGWLCPGGELFDLATHAVNFLLSVSTCFYATLKILLSM